MRLSILVFGMFTLAVPAASTARQPAPPKAALFESWLRAVREHEPGMADPSARRVAGWSRRDLLVTINAIRRQKGELPRALLNRGAVLHLDIEILFRPVAAGLLFTERLPWGQSASGTLMALDGRSRGQGARSTHLDFARALLDAVTPARSENETGKLWYAASAAYLAAGYNLAETLPHLHKARDLFSDSPLILLATGCLHETFASPRVQSVVRVRGQAVVVGSERQNLQLAERYFREALESDPSLGEARLRLGSVLGRRGEHREAVRELQQALKRIPDTQGRYFTLLFLAREQETLGRVEEAIRHYQDASALFPGAQTPYVALSRLAYHDGRGREAERILQRLFKLPADEKERFDPWWDYFSGLGRFAEALLTRIRERVAQGGS